MAYSFLDNKQAYNLLLEELLSSDYCHESNGLTYAEIFAIFNKNNKPVNEKNLKDLLGVWKLRRKLKFTKKNGEISYFIEDIKAIKTGSFDFDEIIKLLGKEFLVEMRELKIASQNCSNCTAFLMRKILEKLLFIILSKSDKYKKIKKYKEEHKLPQLTDLINLAQSAEINKRHIIQPNTLRKIEPSKFFGDNAAHNYLTSVSFEDLKSEAPYWRMAIKELAKNI